MSPVKKIVVENIEIAVFEKPSEDDFICLTDIVRLKGDESRAADIIKNWLRNRSTIEFLGKWERYLKWSNLTTLGKRPADNVYGECE